MLRLQDVSLMRGVRVLYSHATLLANPGERIGLVGAAAPADSLPLVGGAIDGVRRIDDHEHHPF